MINTEKLQAAKVDGSNNWFLSGVWGSVAAYNTIGNASAQDKIDVLERVLGLCGEWLTSKRPKNTPTNRARWLALEDMANQVVFEGAKLNARFLTGHTDWKKIGAGHGDRSYWLEFLSPEHGVGFFLSAEYAKWRDSTSMAYADESFWDYVKRASPYNTMLVKYYGSTPKAEKRRVYFNESHLLRRAIDDSLFDTQALETAASGQGWAIFVVSPEGKMYAHKHVVGKYHHSTFLSGSAVLCAGEMVVVQGKVRCITSKSGHYMPTPENMKTLVQKFPQLPSQTILIPDFTGNPLPAYTVGEYKFNAKTPASVSRAKVQAALPVWALVSAGARGMVNKIAP